jgi:hypothetical protein
MVMKMQGRVEVGAAQALPEGLKPLCMVVDLNGGTEVPPQQDGVRRQSGLPRQTVGPNKARPFDVGMVSHMPDFSLVVDWMASMRLSRS